MTSTATTPATGPTSVHLPLLNGNGAHALPQTNGTAAPVSFLWSTVDLAGPEALTARSPGIDITDWDIMFGAVRTRLLHSVGERLGELPHVPQHSAELSASLVQAAVLDCVNALDQLHAALKQERSQRPTS